MSCRCGCCEGIERLTPATIENRPGLSSLAYRVGTHATFLASMEAALSAQELHGAPNALRALTTREPSDFTVSLLDAWAIVADVLSFYDERIANEGYLRTATERRSVLELARLIGYRLRPGVAASTFLAFTLEDGHELEIPRGTRAQSVPGPGGLPQPFETSEPLHARSEWNVLRPRTTAPQALQPGKVRVDDALYLAGLPSVREGSFLLLVDGSDRVLCRARSVEADAAANRTKVLLQPVTGLGGGAALVAFVRELVTAASTEAVARTTATGQRVATILQRVADAAHEEADPAELASALRTELLPELRHEYAHAQPFPRLEPWIGALVAGLSQAADRLAATAPHAVLAPPAEEPPAALALSRLAAGDAFGALGRLIGPLTVPPSVPPRNRFALAQTLDSLAPPSDAAVHVAAAFHPGLSSKVLYDAWGRLVQPAAGLAVYLLKLTGAPFGQNALRKPAVDEGGQLLPQDDWPEWDPAADEDDNILYLDGEHPEIGAQSFAVIQRPDDFEPKVFVVDSAVLRGRSEYGLAGKTTVLRLDGPWWHPAKQGPIEFVPAAAVEDNFTVIRRTVVHAASEQLELAEAPVAEPVHDDQIDLDTVYDGLGPGRWLIVAGDRVLDPKATRLVAAREERARFEFARAGVGLVKTPTVQRTLPTVPAAELVMLGGVQQRVGVLPGRTGKLAGDKPRTWLTLARKLAYTYVRDSVRIYANVIDSTHGETRNEVLGSGDASRALQRFQLKSKPLTFVSADTPEGASSTLEVRVDGVRWHEAPGIGALGPRDREYLTETADDGSVSVVFGDGRRGERLPTGIENVAAVYRSGIGEAANLDAGRITQLASKPLGVKDVTNPLPAAGGADPDPRDAARRLAPLSVTALDRLVSVRDYEDFTRLFAGIGKASAVQLSDGRRQLVHVTIAGVDDIPIAGTSDLFANLTRALRDFGDPHLPVLVVVRELLLLVVAANVRVQTDYVWELVEPQVRAALVEVFGFDSRELGQSVTAGEVVAAIQAVPGVAFVDLDTLDAISLAGTMAATPSTTVLALRQRVRAELARVEVVQAFPAPPVAGGGGLQVVRAALAGHPERRILPAQLAILKADVPDTLLLTELHG
jgi:hypothetical protein